MSEHELHMMRRTESESSVSVETFVYIHYILENASIPRNMIA